jgi:hypothetical protein
MKLLVTLFITVCILFILYPKWFRLTLLWAERIFFGVGGKFKW